MTQDDHALFAARVEELAEKHLPAKAFAETRAQEGPKDRTECQLYCLAAMAHVNVGGMERAEAVAFADLALTDRRAESALVRTRRRLVRAVLRGVQARKWREWKASRAAEAQRCREEAARRAEAAGVVCDYLEGFCAAVYSLACRRTGREAHLITSIYSEEGRLGDERAFGLPWPQRGMTPEASAEIAAECERAVHRRAARLPEDLGFSPADVAEGLARWEQGRAHFAAHTAECLADEMEEARDLAERGRGILCPRCGRLADLGARRCPTCERLIS